MIKSKISSIIWSTLFCVFSVCSIGTDSVLAVEKEDLYEKLEDSIRELEKNEICSAIFQDNSELLDFILHEKSAVDDYCLVEVDGAPYFYPPLKLAYVLERNKLFQKLLNSKIIYSESSLEFLFESAASGDLYLIQQMIEHGRIKADIKYNNKTLLDEAIKSKNQSLIEYLNSRDVPLQNIYDKQEKKLYIALRTGNIHLLKRLLNNRDNQKKAEKFSEHIIFDILTNDDSKVFAVYINNSELVNYIPYDIEKMIILAVEYESLKTLNYILSHKQHQNIQLTEVAEEELLSRIIYLFFRPTYLKQNYFLYNNNVKDPAKILSVFLRNGFDFDKKIGNRDYFLILALQYDAFDFAWEVINYGAKLDIVSTDDYDTPAIIYAAEKNRLDLVRYFYEHGVNLNQTDYFGDTALIYASGNGHLQVTRYLVENGASIDQQTRDGDTALLASAENGQIEVFDYLISKGARINHRNKFKEGVRELAQKNNQKEFLAHLKEEYDK